MPVDRTPYPTSQEEPMADNANAVVCSEAVSNALETMLMNIARRPVKELKKGGVASARLSVR